MDHVRVASKRGFLRAGLRTGATGLVVVPIWALAFGPRPVFLVSCFVLLFTAGLIEVAVEPWAARRGQACVLGTLAVLLMAWIAPTVSMAQEVYFQAILTGLDSGRALDVAGEALRLGSWVGALSYHGSALLLATPVAAAAAARLHTARRSGHLERSTMDVRAGLGADAIFTAMALAMLVLADALRTEHSHVNLIEPLTLSLVSVAVLFLTCVVTGLGELAGRLEDRLVRARVVR